MSAITPEKLYALLPAVHRVRDQDQGAPLQALLALLAKSPRVRLSPMLELAAEEVPA